MSPVHRNRTRMQRSGLVWAAGVISIALVASCSNGGGDTLAGAETPDWSIPDTDPVATIDVLSHLSLEPTGSFGNMQPVIDAFEDAHPNISVNFETVPFEQIASTLDARIANGDGNPDVYWVDQPRIAAVASRGGAEDLTGVFSEYEDAFAPAAYESGVWNDRLWAVPISSSTQLLFYNRELLSQAGLPDPSASTDERMTWEDLATNAESARASGAQYGFTFGQFDRYYQLQPLPMQLGGSAGATGEGNLTPDITSDEWVEAMTWYRDLFESGAAPRGVTSEQTDPAFLAGQTAYHVQGPWLLPLLQDSDIDWGVAPQPVFEEGEPVTPTGSWSLGINPFSDEKEAAALFIKWMAIDDGSGYITHRSNPEFPANVEANAIYFGKDVFDSAEGGIAATIMEHETTNTAVNRVSTIGYLEFETIIDRAFADIRNGADPESALEDASAELTRTWQKYQ